MSPVRTTKSASGPFSVRSYLSAQSRAGSPVAATGITGADICSGVEAADAVEEDAGATFPFSFGANAAGESGVLVVLEVESDLEDDECSAFCRVDWM